MLLANDQYLMLLVLLIRSMKLMETSALVANCRWREATSTVPVVMTRPPQNYTRNYRSATLHTQQKRSRAHYTPLPLGYLLSWTADASLTAAPAPLCYRLE